MKYKIFIFGTASESRTVCLDLKENVELLGYLDNNRNRQGTLLEDGKPVLDPWEIRNIQYDFIVISLLKHIDQVRVQLEELGASGESVIRFFFSSESEQEIGKCILDPEKWMRDAAALENKFQMEALKRQMELWKNNAAYEIAGLMQEQRIRFPEVRSAEQALDRILLEGCSMCRFGDGEFEMMRGNERPLFQKPAEGLSTRLKEVFCSRSDKILIAVPDQFGSLEAYTQQAADDIREYMNEETRAYLDSILQYDRIYYDTYLTRPYYMYKDKQGAGERFKRLKQIWEGRDVVIIEGSETRMGVGNDLLDRAGSVQRIIGPAENAFDKYDELLEAAKSIDKEKLILILLGPTATVLAYDLALEGYQALDIGHIDIEYEWFLRRTDVRVDIPGKYVNEICGGQKAVPCADEAYRRQIMAVI